MKKLTLIIALLLSLLLLLTSLPALALDVEIGQQIQLKATNPLGVPLHKNAFSSLKDRVKDDAQATVIDTDNNKHWLNISTESGQQGWIIEKYVSQIIAEEDNNDTVGIEPHLVQEVWSSAPSCQTVVNNRQLLPRKNDTLRIGTWNIRWFPDGSLNSNDNSQKTDLDWLSCTIAWMDVDVLALQEIRTTPTAQTAWNSVIKDLNEYTGGNWQKILNGCGSPNSQHLGFLYNADKITPKNKQEVWQFNGASDDASEPCAGNLRPGYRAFFESPDGFDFYAISVHLDSGIKDRDISNRRTAAERIDQVTEDIKNIDGDIIILGDFNTMGTGSEESAREEIEELKAKAKQEEPGFTLVEFQPSCSHYFNKNPGLLDHILVSDSTIEDGELKIAQASVQGYCALNKCESIDQDMPSSYQKLSDHCPVLIDFINQDLDT